MALESAVVNALVAGLLACTPSPEGVEGAAPAPSSGPLLASPALSAFQPTVQARTARPAGVERAAARAPRVGEAAALAPGPDAVTLVGGLVPALEAGRFDQSRGEALRAVIDALPPERAALGTAGVGYQDYADLCEQPLATFPVEHDGQEWEVTLDLPRALWLTGEPTRDLYALSAECVDALGAAAGDVAAVVEAGCAEADEAAHFPAGSDCRSCLELDGDHPRCVADGACPQEATARTALEGGWYALTRTTGLYCAPDVVGEVFLADRDLAEDDPLPGPYEHGRYDAYCLELWSDGLDEPRLYCDPADWGGFAWGDVLPSTVEGALAHDGSTAPIAGRTSLVGAAQVDGHRFTRIVATEGGAVALSAPDGSAPDAWGINPMDLRPDGTDPTRRDDTMAREYLAALVLKTATTIDGIYVWAFNHNRCAEADWRGPLADGSYACEAPGAWSTDGWRDDAMVSWYGDGGIYPFPLMTLASTGLPDPAAPGGVVPRVLGSTTLADPEWEGCAWPETFVPDRVRLRDEQPAVGTTPYATFDGQTWRLGKDGPDGVVLGLLTNQRRAFCPG